MLNIQFSIAGFFFYNNDQQASERRRTASAVGLCCDQRNPLNLISLLIFSGAQPVFCCEVQAEKINVVMDNTKKALKILVRIPFLFLNY
jgi:hypothetical protein